jgi:DNA-binding response OmpR family regulator
VPTVVVFSHDPVTRDQVRLAIGRLPSADLGPIDFTDESDANDLLLSLAKGGIDLLILDGEAKPEGGLGLARRVKDEIAGSPPVLLVVARAADMWLARWSKAEGVVQQPIDPGITAAQAVRLLQLSADREPVVGRKGPFGITLKARP